MASTQIAHWHIQTNISGPTSSYEDDGGVPKSVLDEDIMSVPPEKACLSPSDFGALHPTALDAVVGDIEASDNNSPCESLESVHIGGSDTSEYGDDPKTMNLGKTDLPPADDEVCL